MTDIALIQCTNKPLPFDDSAIPIQLLSVAGTLKERGFKTKVFDIRRDIERDRPIGKCDLIVVNVTTGQSIKEGLSMARMADYLGIPIVWMGSHVSVLPEQSIKSKFVDYVIVGDADLVLPELAMRLESKQEVTQRIWMKDVNNLDALPFVPFDLIDFEEYSGGVGLPILTSRGCPHACAFCLDRAVNRGHWRSMSPPRVIEHVEYYKDAYGIKDFKFFDDNFCADLERAEKVSRGIIKEKLDIDWSASCRVDYVKDMSSGLFKLMKDSGCWNLAFGFESGSQRMLDLVNKHVTVEEILDACDKLVKNEIGFGGTFQVGLPGETDKDVVDSINLMLFLIRCKATFETYDYVPHPGTELFKRVVELGFPNPDTLEGWSETDFAYKPWVSKPHRVFIDQIKLMAEVLGKPNNIAQRIARDLVSNIKRKVG